MGLFDEMTSGMFKTTEDGRRLFFPWETLGRGYVIPSEEAYQILHRVLKRHLMIMLSTIFLTGMIFPFAFAFPVATRGTRGMVHFLMALFVVITLETIPYFLWLRGRCRRLERTDERLTIQESMANLFQTYKMRTLIGLECALLVVIAGVCACGMLTDRSIHWIIPGTLIVIPALLFIFMGIMIAMKIRTK